MAFRVFDMLNNDKESHLAIIWRRQEDGATNKRYETGRR